MQPDGQQRGLHKYYQCIYSMVGYLNNIRKSSAQMINSLTLLKCLREMVKMKIIMSCIIMKIMNAINIVEFQWL